MLVGRDSGIDPRVGAIAGRVCQRARPLRGRQFRRKWRRTDSSLAQRRAGGRYFGLGRHSRRRGWRRRGRCGCWRVSERSRRRERGRGCWRRRRWWEDECHRGRGRERLEDRRAEGRRAGTRRGRGRALRLVRRRDPGPSASERARRLGNAGPRAPPGRRSLGGARPRFARVGADGEIDEEHREQFAPRQCREHGRH
jgi:hypothetical protein